MTTNTLINRLSTLYPDSSKRTLQNWIKNGRVLVNGEVIHQPFYPISDTTVDILLRQKTLPSIRGGIKILYQDRWLVAIYKPVGLLSVPSENPSEISALLLLKAHFKSHAIIPVHRLDREASGVLVFARGHVAREKMAVLFENHDLERIYAAILEGQLCQDSGTWIHYLKEQANYDVTITSRDRGKKSITHFKVLKRTKSFTHVQLQLETGKKHQIRVHCSEAGYPIAGDKRYGSLVDPVRRLCLHAFSLKFVHPFTKKTLSIEAPLPYSFYRIGYPNTTSSK